MARSSELRVVISGDPRGLHRAFASASTSASQFEQKIGRTGDRARAAFGILAKSGALAAGLGLGSILRAGVEFEKQMARVKAVSNATGAEFDTLNKLAKRLGAETKYSAGQAAEGMYELASAGFSVEEINKALPGTLSLAAASSIDLKKAAEISANALRGFGLDASKSGHVADILAMAVNTSSVEMRDLQYSLKYVAPVARATGQSMEDVTAALDAMGDAGIKGETAGTTLRGALVRLTKPTDDVVAGFDMLGVKAGAFYGPKGLKPLPELIKILEQRTKGMSVAQRNQALALIFGTNAVSGMSAVIQKGSEKVRENSKELKNSEGAAKRAATIMNNTVAGAWENFTGSVETASISLYEQFAPALKDALKAAAGGVNDVAKLPAKLADTFGKLRDQKGSVGAALGAMIVQGISNIDWGALGQKVSAGFNKALKIGKSIASNIMDAVGQVPWGRVGEKISGGFDAALTLGDKLPGAIEKGLGDAVSHVNGRQVLGKLVDIIGEAVDALFSPSFWVDHFKAIFSVVTLVIPVGKLLKIPGFNTLFRFISKPVFQAIGALGRGMLSLFGKASAEAGIRFLVELEKVAPKTARFLLWLVTRSGRALGELPGRLGRIAKDAAESVAKRLGEGAGAIVGTVARWVVRGAGKLLDGVVSFARGGGRLAAGVLRGLDDRLGNLPSRIGNALAAAVRRIVSWVGDFLKAAQKLGAAIIDGIVAGIKAAPGKVKSAIGGVLSGAFNFVKDKIGDGIGEVVGRLGYGGIGIGGGALMGADPDLAPFAGIAANMGLRTSSGLRVGSITSTGNVSYHASGDAIDEVGPMSAMRRYASTLYHRFGGRLRELISPWSELGIKDGRPFRYSGQILAQHSGSNAHVHVAYTGPFGDGLGRRIGDGLGRFVSTSYGPPWGGIQGSGVTATGIDLRRGQEYHGIAVDPRVIPLHKRVKVWPNPFKWRGTFLTFDTGGAIKGRRIDFYDWRGRKAQRAWGRRSVVVSDSSTDGGARTGGGNETSRPGPASLRGESREGAAGLPGGPPVKPLKNPPTRLDQLEAEAAEAGLTARTEDDLTAAGHLVTYWWHRLRRARKSGDPRRIREAAEGLKAARDARAGFRDKPTRLDRLNADVANASLTADLGDDLTAAKALRDYYQRRYDKARKTADPRDDVEAAQNLKSAQEAVESLTEQMTKANDLEQQRIDLEKQRVVQMARSNDLAERQGPYILAQMAQLMSGAIGRGVNNNTPSAPGVVGRY